MRKDKAVSLKNPEENSGAKSSRCSPKTGIDRARSVDQLQRPINSLPVITSPNC